MNLRRCKKCGQDRELTDFHKDRSKRDGLASCCNHCAKEYRLQHKARENSRSQAYYAEHREIIRKQKQEYRAANPEKQAEYRKRTKAHAAKRERIRRASDELFRVSKCLRRRLREALRTKGAIVKNGTTEQLLGCSFSALLQRLGTPPSPDAHIDHICPLAQAKTVEELHLLSHYSNLCWMSPIENIKKRDRWTEEGAHLCRILLGREWEEKKYA